MGWERAERASMRTCSLATLFALRLTTPQASVSEQSMNTICRVLPICLLSRYQSQPLLKHAENDRACSWELIGSGGMLAYFCSLLKSGASLGDPPGCIDLHGKDGSVHPSPFNSVVQLIIQKRQWQDLAPCEHWGNENAARYCWPCGRHGETGALDKRTGQVPRHLWT